MLPGLHSMEVANHILLAGYEAGPHAWTQQILSVAPSKQDMVGLKAVPALCPYKAQPHTLGNTVLLLMATS
jgi:hypothetical protein